ncbi:MAG: hypothetical protein LBG80_10715 [Bacteroidales bacterium]|nr:hypothetical protein [Bacteroidales bacterium]
MDIDLTDWIIRFQVIDKTTLHRKILSILYPNLISQKNIYLCTAYTVCKLNVH